MHFKVYLRGRMPAVLLVAEDPTLISGARYQCTLHS
jgi:hypothetical protein